MKLKDQELSEYPCYVCGKVWKRKDVDKYEYFNGILVCSHHAGAKEWIDGALKLTTEKCKQQGLTLELVSISDDDSEYSGNIYR